MFVCPTARSARFLAITAAALLARGAERVAVRSGVSPRRRCEVRPAAVAAVRAALTVSCGSSTGWLTT